MRVLIKLLDIVQILEKNKLNYLDMRLKDYVFQTSHYNTEDNEYKMDIKIMITP